MPHENINIVIKQPPVSEKLDLREGSSKGVIKSGTPNLTFPYQHKLILSQLRSLLPVGTCQIRILVVCTLEI